MLRIAICDDQPRELDIISKHIKNTWAWRLSRFLGAELERYGVEGAYSRDDISKDKELELRGKVAHDNGSDLFISLHSDGYTTPTASGVTVFYSNFRHHSKTLGEALGRAVASTMGLHSEGQIHACMAAHSPILTTTV